MKQIYSSVLEIISEADRSADEKISFGRPAVLFYQNLQAWIWARLGGKRS